MARKETTMPARVRTMIARRRETARLAIRAAAIAGAALFVCACTTDQPQVAGVSDAPSDYRLRHPITIRESDRTLEIFIGSNRGSLDPGQRAQVLAFAQTWRREATGGVLIDVPVGSSNERAAADSLREVRSILAATGVPADGVMLRSYHPSAGRLATVRVTYPKITAQVGPCGIWPQDIGPSMNREYFENQQYWNFGCASQRNLASMVANPADLVQPRAETAIDTTRQTTVVDKYRQGASTATTYPNSAVKISDFGQ
jgi:pilus assembly protein CpaD